MGCYPIITTKPLRDELGERREEEDKGWRRSMVWGVSLILSVMRRKGWKMVMRRRGVRGEVGDKEEKNKSWLLGEEDDGEGEKKGGREDLLFPSVHSSFRFSFGSQAEAEGSGGGPTEAAVETTVLLLVNLEGGEGGEEEEERERQKWRRLDSLERSISPVVGMMVRFSYEQIRTATRDFARGKILRAPI